VRVNVKLEESPLQSDPTASERTRLGNVGPPDPANPPEIEGVNVKGLVGNVLTVLVSLVFQVPPPAPVNPYPIENVSPADADIPLMLRVAATIRASFIASLFSVFILISLDK
jgi:hypothetical protein